MDSQYGLPAQLDGVVTDAFRSNWNVVKDKIFQLRNLPNTVTNRLMKYGVDVTNLRTNPKIPKYRADQLIKILQFDIDKAHDDLRKAWVVKQRIDKYLPEWIKAARHSGSIETVGGLGVVFVLGISVAAIAALAYTVTTGMAIWSEYKTDKPFTGGGGSTPPTLPGGDCRGFFGKLLCNLGAGLGQKLAYPVLIGGVVLVGYGFWKYKKNPPGGYSSIAKKHQLKIAEKTLKMPDAMAGVMGGMSKSKAKDIIKKHK